MFQGQYLKSNSIVGTAAVPLLQKKLERLSHNEILINYFGGDSKKKRPNCIFYTKDSFTVFSMPLSVDKYMAVFSRVILND